MRVRDVGVQSGAEVAMENACAARMGRSRFGARLALVAALALPVVVSSSEAWAQAAGASSSKNDEAARFFTEGTKAADAGRWEDARKAFTEAWKRKQHWQIAAHLGRAELMAGHPRDAAEHLSYFLREAKDLSAEDRKQSQELMDRALTKVGAVTVSVNVAGAEVFVDGRAVGRAPLKGPVFVELGRRVFEARQEGYATAKVTEEVKAGGTLRVDLPLRRTDSSQHNGLSVVAGDVNERSVAETSASVGAYKVVVISGVVSTAVLTVGAVTFAIISNAKSIESNSYQGREEYKDKYEDLQSLRAGLANASFQTFIGVGVLGGATLAYAIIAKPERARSSTSASVFVGKRQVGGVFEMRW